MSDPTSTPTGFFARLRTRAGRRVLLFFLFGGMGLVAWWYFARMPSEGTVEVRWTENPPAWVAVSYTDESGETVRWRKEPIAPGTDRFHDAYKLAPGMYWLRIEYQREGRIRSVRKRVELPAAEPYLLMLEELEAP
jgi:hypothetical protein